MNFSIRDSTAQFTTTEALTIAIIIRSTTALLFNIQSFVRESVFECSLKWISWTFTDHKHCFDSRLTKSVIMNIMHKIVCRVLLNHDYHH